MWQIFYRVEVLVDECEEVKWKNIQKRVNFLKSKILVDKYKVVK